MIDELNKRIIEVMVRTEHSKSSFASALGVSLPLITHITTGRNKPGMDLVQKLLSHFEQISPDWLLLGTGDMYRQQQKQKDFSPLVSQLETLVKEIEGIKQAHQTVVQYHKILFEEIRHLEEMDLVINRDTERLSQISGQLQLVKTVLLSEQ